MLRLKSMNGAISPPTNGGTRRMSSPAAVSFRTRRVASVLTARGTASTYAATDGSVNETGNVVRSGRTDDDLAGNDDAGKAFPGDAIDRRETSWT